MKYVPYNRIEVSRSALLHNLDLYEHMSNRQAIPVLKGNAYGHGIELVAKVLKEKKLTYIAVNAYSEALQVRKVSDQPVLIMGSIRPEGFAYIQYKNFAFVVQDQATIHALGKVNKRVKVHLECNTGMNRYGAMPCEITYLTKLITQYKNLKFEGVMSHLADSDGNDPSTVDAAVKKFDACVNIIRAAGGNPHILHIAQSAGSLKAKSKFANYIRLGIGLYGINPFPFGHELYEKLEGLQPTLALISTLTKIIHLQKGDKVSYNYTFTAPKQMAIGVVPIGYYEGLNRSLSNVGVVKVGERFTPITGRVCMHYTMVSLDKTHAKVGDEITIYSNVSTDQNSIDTIAEKHGLFTNNLLSDLNNELYRVLVQ